MKNLKINNTIYENKEKYERKNEEIKMRMKN